MLEAQKAVEDAHKAMAGHVLWHVNSTAQGGGVAEILHTLVPLMRDVGIDARWEVIRGEDDFFNVTKAFHNGLQGAPVELTPEMREIYKRYNEQNAADLEGEYDYILVHDPQPAAMRHYHNPAAAKQVRQWADGNLTTPTFDIDGTIVVDFQKDRLDLL